MFDELELWQASEYSTFEVELTYPDQDSLSHLVELCNQRELGIEDWSTLRWICSRCSRSNPGEHQCDQNAQGPARSMYALAAPSSKALIELLDRWASPGRGRAFGDPGLLVDARPAAE